MALLPALHPFLTPLGVYQLALLIFAGLISLNAAVNFFVFRRPRAPLVPDDELPFISVLIPARNEEDNIESCVRSLLRQNYPNFEVVVLDDNSEDATYDILCRLRDQDQHLRVLVGAQLPAGWCGKPHACWQLAHAARGTHLLMTDADCAFAPDALLLAVGCRRETRSDVISLMPDYVAVTFWEKLIIPLLVMIPFGFLPMYFVRNSRDPKFAAANGAFIFLTKETYFAVGGHRAVKTELAEDIKFSQLVKAEGCTLTYADGKNAYNVRMYDGLPAIWRGFTRNLFPAFGHSLFLCGLAMFVVLNLFVLPPFFALAGFLLGAPWASLALASYLLMAGLRLALATVLGRDRILYAFLDPLAWMVALGIAWDSVAKNRGKGAEWKGRVYPQAVKKAEPNG